MRLADKSVENRLFYMSLLFGLAVFGLIHFLNFKGSVPYFVEATGGGALFDTAIPRSTAELYSRLEQFGDEGRNEYLFRNLTTDILLPISLLPVLILGTRRLIKRFARSSSWRLLYVLPIAYVGFDFAENLIVVELVRNFPAQQIQLAEALPFVTMTKRLMIFSSLIFLFVGLAVAKVRRPPEVS